MTYYGKTDKGIIRETNQDAFGIYNLQGEGVLFAICDGMGGVTGGEEASKLALDAYSTAIDTNYTLLCEQKGDIEPAEREIKYILNNASANANAAVWEYAQKNSQYMGMGTTLVSALSINGGEKVYMLNIGDSRLYKISSTDIFQISRDHSYVQYLVDIGEMTPEEAKNSPDKNIITRAVGIDPDVEADITAVDTSKNEMDDTYFLLCSDGLTNMISDDEIFNVVNSSCTVEQKVNKLINTANSNGGTDNITVILISLA